MRVAVERFGVEPDQIHQPAGVGKRRVAVEAVIHRAFDDRVADRSPWIERAIRILKDNLYPASEPMQRTGTELRHVLAVKDDPSRAWFDQPRDAARDRRLARSRFADDAERFAAANFQRYRRSGGNVGATTKPSGPAVSLGQLL